MDERTYSTPRGHSPGWLEVGALWLVSLMTTGCFGTHECPQSHDLAVSVRADLACPAPPARQPTDQVDTTVEVDTSKEPDWSRPKVVCWYRLENPANDLPCEDEKDAQHRQRLSRTYHLRKATEAGYDERSWWPVASWTSNESHDETPETESLISCDDQGVLYGRVTQVTSDAPSDCPDQLTAESEPSPKSFESRRVTHFVGRDEYPSRQRCAYKVTRTYTCPDHDIGLGNAWPGP